MVAIKADDGTISYLEARLRDMLVWFSKTAS